MCGSTVCHLYAWKFALGALVLFVNANWENNREKKTNFSPAIQIFGRKTKNKSQKKIDFRGVSFAKMPVSQILKVCTVDPFWGDVDTPMRRRINGWSAPRTSVGGTQRYAQRKLL